MLEATFERARLTWDNFNDRERRLISIMMSVFAVAMFSLFVYLAQSGNTALEEESAALREALDLVASQREKLIKIADDRRASEERYKQTAPPLGSLLEAKAKEQSITLREVNEEPEKISGNFKRRGARVSLPGVTLTPIMMLMSEVKRSPYPVAVEYVQIEHYAAGQDNYTVQLGLVAYDKQSQAKAEGTPGKATDGEAEEDSE